MRRGLPTLARMRGRNRSGVETRVGTRARPKCGTSSTNVGRLRPDFFPNCVESRYWDPTRCEAHGASGRRPMLGRKLTEMQRVCSPRAGIVPPQLLPGCVRRSSVCGGKGLARPGAHTNKVGARRTQGAPERAQLSSRRQCNPCAWETLRSSAGWDRPQHVHASAGSVTPCRCIMLQWGACSGNNPPNATDRVPPPMALCAALPGPPSVARPSMRLAPPAASMGGCSGPPAAPISGAGLMIPPQRPGLTIIRCQAHGGFSGVIGNLR